MLLLLEEILIQRHFFILLSESLLHARSHEVNTSPYNLNYRYNLYTVLNTATT